MSTPPQRPGSSRNQGPTTRVTTTYPGTGPTMTAPQAQNPFETFSGHPSQFNGGGGGGGGGQASGKDRLLQAVSRIGDTGLNDQHDLAQFCESFRQIQHFLAVQAQMSGAELLAGAKQMDKRGIIAGFSAQRRMKKVAKAMDAAGASAAGSAGQIIAAYQLFEREFEEALSGKQAKQKRGFGIV